MNVLIASDGSGPALDACRLVAQMIDARRDRVRLLAVLSYELYPSSLVPGEHPVGEHEAAERVQAEIDRLTRDGRAVIEEAGITPTIAHRFGNAADQIVAEADASASDLIVLGRRGVRGLERVLGSVSEHVLHHVKKSAILLVP